MTATKQCTKCGAIKPITLFGKHKGFASGYGSRCRVCLNEYDITYRKRIKMNKTKFYALADELDLITKKVLISVPKLSDWDFNSIAKDIERNNGARMATDKLKFCLNGLVNVGLISLKNGRYQQAVIIEKEAVKSTPIKVAISAILDELSAIRVAKLKYELNHDEAELKLFKALEAHEKESKEKSSLEEELLSVKAELEKANSKLKLVKDHHELMSSL